MGLLIYLRHLRHASTDPELVQGPHGWKALRIQLNPRHFKSNENYTLSIKEITEPKCVVCSFPIFEVFDIHSIGSPYVYLL